MKSGIERCESPMEAAFVEALARFEGFYWREERDAEYEVGIWRGWAIALLAQVPFDKYRVDFVLTSCSPMDGDTLPWLVIIEIDGHDFHERTKEQALRDRSRDRFFTSRGARVLRFTGSEVYRDAVDCARQALEVACRLQTERFDEALIDHIESDVVEKWKAMEAFFDWLYPGRGGYERLAPICKAIQRGNRPEGLVRRA